MATQIGTTGETPRKLDHLPTRLSQEFSGVTPDDVRPGVVEVAQRLLGHARFTDYVPVLTYRYVREHLLDQGHRLRRAA